MIFWLMTVDVKVHQKKNRIFVPMAVACCGLPISTREPQRRPQLELERSAAAAKTGAKRKTRKDDTSPTASFLFFVEAAAFRKIPKCGAASPVQNANLAEHHLSLELKFMQSRCVLPCAGFSFTFFHTSL